MYTQALFGKMVDKTPVPDAIDLDTPLNKTSRRRIFNARRQAEEEAEEETSEASGFSDAFGIFVRVCVVLYRAAAYEVHIDKEVHTPAWANLKFDKAFTLRETSCAHKYLKDFWATTGTFITALCSAGLFRSLIDLLTRKLFHMVRVLSVACTHAHSHTYAQALEHKHTYVCTYVCVHLRMHMRTREHSYVPAYSFPNS